MDACSFLILSQTLGLSGSILYTQIGKQHSKSQAEFLHITDNVISLAEYAEDRTWDFPQAKQMLYYSLSYGRGVQSHFLKFQGTKQWVSCYVKASLQYLIRFN